jgi:hypothetical protein
VTALPRLTFVILTVGAEQEPTVLEQLPVDPPELPELTPLLDPLLPPELLPLELPEPPLLPLEPPLELRPPELPLLLMVPELPEPLPLEPFPPLEPFDPLPELLPDAPPLEPLVAPPSLPDQPTELAGLLLHATPSRIPTIPAHRALRRNVAATAPIARADSFIPSPFTAGPL